jgi:hypothetical protein
MAITAPTEAKPRRVRRRPDNHRWLREVKAIIALGIAGFALVSLLCFDPVIAPGEQRSPVGPVGVWLAWAAFQSLGYAALLLPLLLAVWGVATFVKTVSLRSGQPLIGLGLLVVTATGLLAQAARALGYEHSVPGGVVCWALN